jgi:hypothetical protein
MASPTVEGPADGPLLRDIFNKKIPLEGGGHADAYEQLPGTPAEADPAILDLLRRQTELLQHLVGKGAGGAAEHPDLDEEHQVKWGESLPAPPDGE